MTYIWIVAIERYGADRGDQRGPIDISALVGVQALELAKDCAARDPQAQIVLSVSLHARPEYIALKAELSACVKFTGASQPELRTALNLLQGAGTLLVYWVGHGIMSKDKRLVLAADSEGLDDLRAIDVDSILRHLRSKSYPRMQLGFFDACANVFPQATVTKLGGPADEPTEQYFYFASSAAQVAPANTTRQGFSGTVIAALTDPQREFPPDARKLFADLRSRFDELHLSTRAFPLQWTETSADVWSRQGGVQDEALIRAARVAWCSLGEFEHLRGPAGGCVDDTTLAEAVRDEAVDPLLHRLRETCSERSKVTLLADSWERLKLARSLENDAVALGLPWQDWLVLLEHAPGLHGPQLASSPDSIVDLMLTALAHTRPLAGQDCLVRLLGLAARRIRPIDAGRADALLQAVGQNPILQPRVDAALASLPQVAGPAFLLIALLYESADKRITVAESWVYHVTGESDQAWKKSVRAVDGSMVEQVNALIEQAKSLYSDRPLVIELLAPNELLCGPREFLELIDSELDTKVRLEEENVITLRWHDRMKGDARFLPGTWKQRAREMERQLHVTAEMTCAWADEVPGGQILGIPFPGPSVEVPQRNRGQFFTEMKRGAPYMCWPRTAPADLPTFKQAVRTFVTTHGAVGAPPLGPSDRLIRLAEALRCAKRGSGTADLLDLWLFVDDPARNPYDKNVRFVETPKQKTPV